MKGVAIIILFAAVAAAMPEPEHETELDHVEVLVSCSDDPDTLQAHANCDQFYRCVTGKQVVQSCPSLLLFNAEKNICDWAHNVNCNGRILPEDRPEPDFDPSQTYEICARKDSEGALYAHESCNKFYVCNQIGQASVVRCPDNLYFNPETSQCDWRENVQCGVVPAARAASAARATCVYSEEEESLPFAHENCNRFYKCDASGPVALNCPSGLMFNTETSYCDWPFNVDCGTRTVANIDDEIKVQEPWIPGHGYDDPSQAIAICAAEDSDSILIAHENCNQFYKCYLGAPVAIDCPQYLMYNPKQEYCDWPENVDCGNRKN